MTVTIVQYLDQICDMEQLDQLIFQLDQYYYWDNSLIMYIAAVLLAVGTYLVLYIFKYIIIKQVARLTHKTNTTTDDALIESINRIPRFSYLMISIYAGALVLHLNYWLDKTIDALFIILVISQV